MKRLVKAGFLAGLLGCFSQFSRADQPTGNPGMGAAQNQGASNQNQAMQEPNAAAAPTQVIASELELAGTVQDVSKLRRMIKIKAADGSTVNLKVAPEVAQLDKIKKGEHVDIRYLESVALSLQNANSGAAAPTVAKAVEVAPAQGSTPGAVAVNTQAVTATVEQIDRQNRTIALRDPDGNRIVVKAGPDLQGFDQLKQGDKIQAQYTQALAFEVHPA